MNPAFSIDKNRCRNFWDGEETDRPLVSFWVGSFSIPDLYPISMTAIQDGNLDPENLPFEDLLQDIDHLFKINNDSGSDMPWSAFPSMTIPWLEGIIGCPIIKRGNNIWADPIDLPLEEFLNKPIRLNENKWLHKLLAFTDRLVALADKRFPVSVSLLRGPSDLLSAMRTPSRMCLDLYDNPDLIMQVLEKLTKIWIEVAHMQMERIPPYLGGYSFGQIYLWAPRQCAWFQDDALALISPVHYRQFLLPYEKQIARSIPVSGIHLHPRSLFVVDDLIEIPELDVIEINYEAAGPSLSGLLNIFKKVTAKKRLVIWGDFDHNDIIFLKKNLSERNLCLQVNVPSSKTAFEKLEMIVDVWND